ncbi:MAG: tyrosine--tRNA ligase [Solirubrobacterales bacterium]|nr:tyrosine--tRNA ligase [Solirubrobacterales bacterium]
MAKSRSGKPTLERLEANSVDSLPEGELGRRLAADKPLRIKFGIDPTAPDIHLGHVVILNKLAEFQQAGNAVVLIIGDYTARVGDPSGRDSQRPLLSADEIDANAQTFQEQAFTVLDRDATEVRFNSEWLEMPAEALFGLLSRATVARLLERDAFSKRMAAEQAISALELLYPLLQGYDSVAIDADVELGGTDQKFNLLFARDIQQAYGKPRQAIMTMPILPGLDGHRRMSKSLGNYVGVSDAPADMFGKLMSIPDEVMGSYYRLLLSEEPPEGGHPVEAKRALARQLIERFHDAEAGAEAEAQFDTVHVRHEAPDDVPDLALSEHANGEGTVHLPALLAAAFGISTSEARRMLQQGGVKLEGEPLAAEPLDRPVAELAGKVLQAGKRRFVRLSA